MAFGRVMCGVAVMALARAYLLCTRGAGQRLDSAARERVRVVKERVKVVRVEADEPPAHALA